MGKKKAKNTVKVGSVKIVRLLSEEHGDIIRVEACDADGGQLPLVETLGMLTYAALTEYRLWTEYV